MNVHEVIANWSDFETESDSSEDERDLSSENDDVDDDDATESEKEEVETEVEESVKGAFRSRARGGRGGQRGSYQTKTLEIYSWKKIEGKYKTIRYLGNRYCIGYYKKYKFPT